jgi:hypothetical protein
MPYMLYGEHRTEEIYKPIASDENQGILVITESHKPNGKETSRQ